MSDEKEPVDGLYMTPWGSSTKPWVAGVDSEPLIVYPGKTVAELFADLVREAQRRIQLGGVLSEGNYVLIDKTSDLNKPTNPGGSE